MGTRGASALSCASLPLLCCRKCCDLLQAAGCDVEEADNDGHSAQELAVLGGAEFLLFAAEDSIAVDQISKALEEAEKEREAAAEEVCGPAV